ncbi:hypothetical protein CEXT_342251 [Caerostris extrusa]|uniref:Uncharacterized protein n=1 Tax=Caerostris extrusa TaxID=172846 RepID=A0AAV4VBA0_CAEEX|nr:hypothetical protein CEXT_342251 [Caerostris extrusa]
MDAQAWKNKFNGLASTPYSNSAALRKLDCTQENYFPKIFRNPSTFLGCREELLGVSSNKLAALRKLDCTQENYFPKIRHFLAVREELLGVSSKSVCFKIIRSPETFFRLHFIKLSGAVPRGTTNTFCSSAKLFPEMI